MCARVDVIYELITGQIFLIGTVADTTQANILNGARGSSAAKAAPASRRQLPLQAHVRGARQAMH